MYPDENFKGLKFSKGYITIYSTAANYFNLYRGRFYLYSVFHFQKVATLD